MNQSINKSSYSNLPPQDPAKLIKDFGLEQAWYDLLKMLVKYGMPNCDIYEFAANYFILWQRNQNIKQQKKKYQHLLNELKIQHELQLAEEELDKQQLNMLYYGPSTERKQHIQLSLSPDIKRFIQESEQNGSLTDRKKKEFLIRKYKGLKKVQNVIQKQIDNSLMQKSQLKSESNFSQIKSSLNSFSNLKDNEIQLKNVFEESETKKVKKTQIQNLLKKTQQEQNQKPEQEKEEQKVQKNKKEEQNQKFSKEIKVMQESKIKIVIQQEFQQVNQSKQQQANDKNTQTKLKSSQPQQQGNEEQDTLNGKQIANSKKLEQQNSKQDLTAKNQSKASKEEANQQSQQAKIKNKGDLGQQNTLQENPLQKGKTKAQPQESKDGKQKK